MDPIGRILLIFGLVAGALLLLSATGVLPPSMGSKLIMASMLLTWLVMLSRGFLFRAADRGRASAVFQGNSDGEWLPVLDSSPDGIWIRRMADQEKQNLLLHLKQSDDEERARAWANVSIGWKGHCATGVNGWKGNRCSDDALLPYSRDAVYSCCLRNPDLFTHYAGRLQKTL